MLCCAAEDCKDEKRKGKQTQYEDPACGHCEHRRRFSDFFAGYLLDRDAGLARSHQFTQSLGLGYANVTQLGIVTRAPSGFKFDLCQSHDPRQRLLLDTDVLNSLIGDRPRCPAQYPLFDPDIVLAYKIAKAHPAEPAGEQAEKQRYQYYDRNQNRVVGRPHAEHCGDNREHQLRQAGNETDEQANDVQPFAFVSRHLSVGIERRRDTMNWRATDGPLVCARGVRVFEVGRAQIASCRIAARMVSRMTSASAWSSPGKLTVLLWLPAV